MGGHVSAKLLRTLCVSGAMVASALAWAPGGATAATGWSTPQTLTDLGIVTCPSIATHQGKTYIAVGAEEPRVGVYLVTNASGSWTRTRISRQAPVAVSLVVAPSGAVHVALELFDGAGIKHVTNASGSWVTSHVYGSWDGPYAYHPSITLTPSGAPRIAFQRSSDTGQGLGYARRVSGGWDVDTIGADVAWANSNPLGIDSLGVPHIAFVRKAADDLALATRVGGVWTKGQIVDKTSIDYVDLAVDDDDDLHVAFARGDDTWYATNAGGTPWQTTLVHGRSHGPNIDMISDDRVAIVSTHSDGGILFRSNAGGSFAGVRLSSQTIGGCPDVAVTGGGKARVAWYRETPCDCAPPPPGRLRFAKQL